MLLEVGKYLQLRDKLLFLFTESSVVIVDLLLGKSLCKEHF